MNFSGLIGSEEITKQLIRTKSSEYFTKTILKKHQDEYIFDGWEIVPTKHLKKSVKLKKIKPHDIAFEDRIWSLFARMGFNYLNSDKNFKLNYGKEFQKQIDVFAADNEAILITECKSSKIRTRVPYQKDIHEFIALKEELRKSAQALLQGKQKIAFIFATNKSVLSENDRKRLEQASIWHFNQDDIEYFEQLSEHLGIAAKYQLFGKLFQGQKIPELRNKIPAIKGEMVSGEIYYSFSVEPDFLLKIGFILHRTETNRSTYNAYQRLVKKSRLNNVASFIDNGGFFPNSIIINIQTSSRKQLRFDRVSSISHDSSTDLGILHLPKVYRSAFIIDGQHRIYGYSKAQPNNRHTIPVVAFHNLPEDQQTKIFVDINHEQKTVPANLLRSIMADFNWNSENISLAISALKTKLLTEMNYVENSPLYKRIIISEENKTDTRCLTLQTLLNWGFSSKTNFFGEYKKNTFNPDYLTIFTKDQFIKIDYEETLQKAKKFFNKAIVKIEDDLKEQWGLGSSEHGFIAMNIGVSTIFRVIDDIIYFLVTYQHINPQNLSGEQLADQVIPYLDPITSFVNYLNLEEIKKFRSFFGSGATEKVLRYFQSSIHEEFSDFKPDGLEQWIRESTEEFNSKSRELGHRLESLINDIIQIKLKQNYGEKNWWRLSIPKKIQKDCSDKKIDLGSEELDWRFLNTIHYQDIIKQNWDLIGDYFTPPGLENRGKDKKLEWIKTFNLIRQKYSHPQRENVSEDEYNVLVDINNWVSERLKPV